MAFDVADRDPDAVPGEAHHVVEVAPGLGLDRGGDPELDLDSEMAASGRLVSRRATPTPAALADERTDLWSLSGDTPS